jgi:enolase
VEQAPGDTQLGNCATVRRTKGVLKAVNNVRDKIAKAICGMDALDQVAIDRAMIALDDSPTKKYLAPTRF